MYINTGKCDNPWVGAYNPWYDAPEDTDQDILDAFEGRLKKYRDNLKEECDFEEIVLTINCLRTLPGEIENARSEKLVRDATDQKLEAMQKRFVIMAEQLKATLHDEISDLRATITMGGQQ